MIKQYGKEKGERVYYSFVNKHKLDDSRTMPEHLPKDIAEILTGEAVLRETEERFDWLDETAKLEGNVVRGHAIHAGIPTANKVTYTEDELRQAARTLRGKRLFINHIEGPDQAHEYLREKGSVLDPEVYDLIARIARRGEAAIGEVIDAEYVDSDTRAVEYAASITDPDALRLMKAGKVVGVSVGATPRRTIEQNGTLPVGIFLDDLSLVTAPERLGDPEATAKLWEKLREMAKEQEWPPDPYGVTPEGKIKKPGQFGPEVTVSVAGQPSSTTATASSGHTAIPVGPTREEAKSSEGGSEMNLSKEDLEAIKQGFQETIEPINDAVMIMNEQNGGVKERLKGLEEAFKDLKTQVEEIAGKFKAMEKPEEEPPKEGETAGKKTKETTSTVRQGVIGVPGQEPDLTGQGNIDEEQRPLGSFAGVMARLTGRKQ